jgi:hypothetical protein
MTELQADLSGPNAIDLMARHGFHLAHDSQQTGVLEVSSWRDALIVFFANLALSYNVHITTAHTNPVISIPSQESEWFDEDGPDLAAFLAFMDAQIEHQPDSVVPADDAQLERIAKLVAGVKV